jgi:hypothetical protein
MSTRKKTTHYAAAGKPAERSEAAATSALQSPREKTGQQPSAAMDASERTDVATNLDAKIVAVVAEAGVPDAAIEIAMRIGRNRSSSAERATSTMRTVTTMRW